MATSNFGDDSVGSKLKVEGALLMEVASLFTRGNLTGTQGVAVFSAVAALMIQSKTLRDRGGMASALAMLYVDPDLPVPLVERIIIKLLTETTFRENLANKCERAVALFTEYGVTLDQPWRQCLGALFEAMAQERETGYKTLKKIKAQVAESSDEEESA